MIGPMPTGMFVFFKYSASAWEDAETKTLCAEYTKGFVF